MSMGVCFACNAWLAPVNIRRRDSLLKELLVERLVKNVGVGLIAPFKVRAKTTRVALPALVWPLPQSGVANLQLTALAMY